MRNEQKNGGVFRPRFIREVVETDMEFRSASRQFPASRIAEIQQKEGPCPVRPTFCFRPRDSQAEARAYPVRIRVYDKGQGQLHGVADPLPEAQLFRDELLEPHQIKVQVVFEESERGLIARDPATGMFVKPAADWAEKMGKEPVAEESYMALLEETPNKFVAHPIVPGLNETEVKTQALAIAEQSGMATLFHQTHVVSADGKQWVHFEKVLWITKKDFTESEVKAAFRRLGGEAHPDKRTMGPMAAERQKIATAKVTCLTAARDLAIDWLKGCPSKLKSGKRCGKPRAENSGYCRRHGTADLLEAIAEGAGVDLSAIVAAKTAENPCKISGKDIQMDLNVVATAYKDEPDRRIGDLAAQEIIHNLAVQVKNGVISTINGEDAKAVLRDHFGIEVDKFTTRTLNGNPGVKAQRMVTPLAVVASAAK